MSKVQLGFEESRELLASYGIYLQGELVADLESALKAAGDMGYPVVLKALSEDIIHKSDVGVVFLNLKNPEQLTRAYNQLVANVEKAAARLDGVLIQVMAESGFELLVGAKQDPSFGPVTMVGLGGKYVELFADVSPGIGVLDRDTVLNMLAETKAGRILDGFRGAPLDKESAVDMTARVSRLMAEHPEIHEIDLNPIIVYEKGYAIVDFRLIKGEPIYCPSGCELSAQALNSLEAIFNPRSVAVVGASKPGTMGGIILKNSMGIEKLYPVHPKLKSVQGLTCYPTLSDLPEVPEVGVFAINSEATVRVFEEFCELGGKGAIIFSDGFAEIGRQDLEDRLLALSRQFGVAYIGPNCMGVIDNYSGLNTMFIPEHRTKTVSEKGVIGFITQSGGVGLELLEMMGADNLDIGKWISCGNASSVGVPELLSHLGADPRIKVIAIYLEGIADGLKLMEVGRRVTNEKPVLVIKGGVAGGAAATLSHTASLAGSNEAFRACCKQAGFFLIEDLTEDPKILVNVLSILTTQPKAKGNRAAVVSVGGGAAILLADQITEEGMELSEFAPETKDRLRDLLNGNISASQPEEKQRILQGIGRNPVDLFGNCDDERLLTALRIIDEDPNTDFILAAIYLQVPYLSEYLPDKLIDLRRQMHKPLIVSPRGFSDYVGRCREYLYSKKFQTYTVPMIKPLNIAVQVWRKYGHSFTLNTPGPE